MNRYITSADALKTLKHLAYETALNQHDPYVADVFEYIAKNRLETWVNLIPTADVVEKEQYDRMLEKYDRLLENSTIIADALSKYQSAEEETDNQTTVCPNCGADMRGEEDGSI